MSMSMVGEKGNKTRKVSIKLLASLAPARAEVEAGIVAKADQYIASEYIIE